MNSQRAIRCSRFRNEAKSPHDIHSESTASEGYKVTPCRAMPPQPLPDLAYLKKQYLEGSVSSSLYPTIHDLYKSCFDVVLHGTGVGG